jgi:hypothetical protein
MGADRLEERKPSWSETRTLGFPVRHYRPLGSPNLTVPFRWGVGA